MAAFTTYSVTYTIHLRIWGETATLVSSSLISSKLGIDAAGEETGRGDSEGQC